MTASAGGKSMIVSVNIANVGARTGLGLLVRPPRAAAVPGLRHVDLGVAAPLSGSLRKSPDFGRIGIVGFWDDEAALETFLATERLAPFATGFSARLVPLRAHGSWPGLDVDVPKQRAVTAPGPVVVLTLARFRLSQAPRFFRTSAKAEAVVAGSPGLIWATGLARPPLVATCSLWESAEAAASYAYGSSPAEHAEAIKASNTKPFHHREAFIRFRPVAAAGSLAGKNPLSSDAIAGLRP
jgi:heme-degrading monooxygenase HmoA